MADLFEGDNEPPGSLKVIMQCKKRYKAQIANRYIGKRIYRVEDKCAVGRSAIQFSLFQNYEMPEFTNREYLDMIQAAEEIRNSEELLARVRHNWTRRCESCTHADGGHFEQYLLEANIGSAVHRLHITVIRHNRTLRELRFDAVSFFNHKLMSFASCDKRMLAGISSTARTELVFIEKENLTAHRYVQQILEEHAVPFAPLLYHRTPVVEGDSKRCFHFSIVNRKLLKSKVYASRPHSIEDRKNNIRVEIESMFFAMLKRVTIDLQRGLPECEYRQGGRLPEIIVKT
ncbi:hypothetical protein ANN_19412 [Periplaneta americana]|uniref:Uncharacterized protein n=1 Tax=Periplaneta americana TaxID=6978 RepID=A0ABQ8SAY0_PERAM|nr:hypothetical protein ANN_19412 [Periplaneta americana]